MAPRKVGKTELLQWAARWTRRELRCFDDLRDGAAFVEVFAVAWPRAVKKRLAMHSKPARARVAVECPAYAAWDVVRGVFSDVGIPLTILDIPGAKAGRFKACYPLLVLPYFASMVARMPSGKDFTCQFAHPVDPGLAVFLASPRLVRSLHVGGGIPPMPDDSLDATPPDGRHGDATQLQSALARSHSPRLGQAPIKAAPKRPLPSSSDLLHPSLSQQQLLQGGLSLPLAGSPAGKPTSVADKEVTSGSATGSEDRPVLAAEGHPASYPPASPSGRHISQLAEGMGDGLAVVGDSTFDSIAEQQPLPLEVGGPPPEAAADWGSIGESAREPHADTFTDDGLSRDGKPMGQAPLASLSGGDGNSSTKEMPQSAGPHSSQSTPVDAGQLVQVLQQLLHGLSQVEQRYADVGSSGRGSDATLGISSDLSSVMPSPRLDPLTCTLPAVGEISLTHSSDAGSPFISGRRMDILSSIGNAATASVGNAETPRNGRQLPTAQASLQQQQAGEGLRFQAPIEAWRGPPRPQEPAPAKDKPLEEEAGPAQQRQQCREEASVAPGKTRLEPFRKGIVQLRAAAAGMEHLIAQDEPEERLLSSCRAALQQAYHKIAEILGETKAESDMPKPLQPAGTGYPPGAPQISKPRMDAGLLITHGMLSSQQPPRDLPQRGAAGTSPDNVAGRLLLSDRDHAMSPELCGHMGKSGGASGHLQGEPYEGAAVGMHQQDVPQPQVDQAGGPTEAANGSQPSRGSTTITTSSNDNSPALHPASPIPHLRHTDPLPASSGQGQGQGQSPGQHRHSSSAEELLRSFSRALSGRTRSTSLPLPAYTVHSPSRTRGESYVASPSHPSGHTGTASSLSMLNGGVHEADHGSSPPLEDSQGAVSMDTGLDMVALVNAIADADNGDSEVHIHLHTSFDSATGSPARPPRRTSSTGMLHAELDRSLTLPRNWQEGAPTGGDEAAVEWTSRHSFEPPVPMHNKLTPLPGAATLERSVLNDSSLLDLDESSSIFLSQAGLVGDHSNSGLKLSAAHGSAPLHELLERSRMRREELLQRCV